MIDKKLLHTEALSLGIDLSETMLSQLDTYAQMLVETNKVMNLTAITDPVDIVYKHFIDSLSLLPLLPKETFSMIDVGTGAGFPGMPLLIARPDIQLTLLDGLQKRLTFLQSVCETCHLNANIIHARAEEASHTNLREKFDVATARAVANLPVLCEWCIPYVKEGGSFYAMKGSSGLEELKSAKNAIQTLGGKEGSITSLTIQTASGETEERHIIQIEKIKKTEAQYPRPNGKIKKSPL